MSKIDFFWGIVALAVLALVSFSAARSIKLMYEASKAAESLSQPPQVQYQVGYTTIIEFRDSVGHLCLLAERRNVTCDWGSK